jgi:hypothetical protein
VWSGYNGWLEEFYLNLQWTCDETQILAATYIKVTVYRDFDGDPTRLKLLEKVAGYMQDYLKITVFSESPRMILRQACG